MRYFNPRVNVCVPNISWGLNLHECDILVLTPSGLAYEVEIKTSVADLRADAKKSHKHYHKKLAKLYFCVPAKLMDVALAEIPLDAGLLVVDNGSLLARMVRQARARGEYRWSDQDRLKLLRLGCLRLLSLYENLNRLCNEIQD